MALVRIPAEQRTIEDADGIRAHLARCGIDPKPRLPPIEAIEGCTAVIDSGRATKEILAEAFLHRGDAYRLRRNDIDRALAFMSACGADPEEFRGVELYSSHEALLIEYELALTRIDSRTAPSSPIAPIVAPGHAIVINGEWVLPASIAWAPSP